MSDKKARAAGLDYWQTRSKSDSNESAKSAGNALTANRTRLNLPNVSLAATHKLKAKGTRAEEESVPRHGQKRRERF
ncbi:hypothetical protein N1689_17010 [Pantoea sp. XY16]|uniref:hypothetical protein n=1 Tax=Pantoea sp. XY16 TaxID=2976705 RepID=UPI0021A62AAE|nr:hypothetical protein [Pantoea sp. XY16]MCT2419549.1 hypothetical protein [Pantoea sp. XY16]